MSDQEGPDGHFRIEITRRVAAGESGEVLFYSRFPLKEGKSRLIREADIRTAALLLANIAVSVAVPPRFWLRWIRALAGLRMRKHVRKKFPAFARSLTAVLGERDEEALRDLFRGTRDVRHRRLMLLCAELASRHWHPTIELIGAEGIRKALERGNGVIVWCNQFSSQNLMGKRALHEAGFDCHQVSVSEHGFSNSAFARRFLNPLTVRAENRYLKERVVFDRADTFQVTKRISAILKRNGVVLMTNNIYSGATFAETSFGEAGYQQAATTPVNFAARGGAALFMMSTFETEPFVGYEVVISPEIELSSVPDSVARSSAKNADAIARALLQANGHLLASARRFPEQFMFWAGQAKSIRADASTKPSQKP